jgi:hypothetical protein
VCVCVCVSGGGLRVEMSSPRKRNSSLRAPLSSTPAHKNNNNDAHDDAHDDDDNKKKKTSSIPVHQSEETLRVEGEGGKTKLVPSNNDMKATSLSLSSSPSGTSKRDDNEKADDGERPREKSKLHEELLEIHNCYNANCLALEADPVKKDNWQRSKKYPGEVLCINCSIEEKRQIAEEKNMARDKKHTVELATRRVDDAKDDDNIEILDADEENEKKMRVLKEKNKSRNKPQWLKDWCSTKSGLGKRSKFKVYSYGELFSPQKSRKLSTKYLETVEENMETYSTNPRFIRLSSLPKQVHFADNKPKKRKREVVIHKIPRRATPRKVTVSQLMDAKLICAGSDVLSMKYLGKEYKASITNDRQIAFQGKYYRGPASFCMAVKRMQSPEIKFSSPWVSIKYTDQRGSLTLDSLREKFLSDCEQAKLSKNEMSLDSLPDQEIEMTMNEALEIAINHRAGSLLNTGTSTMKKKKNTVRPKSNFYKRWFPELDLRG